MSNGPRTSLGRIAAGLIGGGALIAAIGASSGHRAATPAKHVQKTGNKAHDLFMEQTPEAQRDYLALVVSETIHVDCRGTRTFFAGMLGDVAMWNVGCASGESFVVHIDPDEQGSVTVIDCPVQKTLTGQSCFETYDANAPVQSGQQMIAAFEHLPPNIRRRAISQFARNAATAYPELGCRVGNQPGVCMNTDFCDGQHVAGHCDGPSDVQCCVSN